MMNAAVHYSSHHEDVDKTGPIVSYMDLGPETSNSSFVLKISSNGVALENVSLFLNERQLINFKNNVTWAVDAALKGRKQCPS